jgi:Fibronectin type III domain
MAEEEAAGHAVKGGLGFLGQKVGPLPLGVWMGIALVVWLYLQRKQGTTAGQATDPAGNVGTIDPATGYVYGSTQDTAAAGGGGIGGGGGTTSTDVTSGSTTAGQYTDNNAWGRAAVQYLVGLGVDPSQANEAVQQFLASQQLTAAQQGDVNLAIQALGAPPNLPGPIGTTPGQIVTPVTGNGTTVYASNPPTGLVATPSTGTVALKWNAVTNAAGYVVSYGTDSGASGGSLNVSSAVTSTTVPGLNPGTLYYFRVQASPARPGDGFASVTATTGKAAGGSLPPGYGWFYTAGSTYTAGSIARRFGISVAELSSLNGWTGVADSTGIPKNTAVKVRGNAGTFNLAAYKSL